MERLNEGEEHSGIKNKNRTSKLVIFNLLYLIHSRNNKKTKISKAHHDLKLKKKKRQLHQKKNF